MERMGASDGSWNKGWEQRQVRGRIQAELERGGRSRRNGCAKRGGHGCKGRWRTRAKGRSWDAWESEDVVVEQTIGTLGFLQVDTAATVQDGVRNENQRQAVQEGGVNVRLYRGRVVRGTSFNSKVVLKAYPSEREAGGPLAQRLAANEVNVHAALQPAEGTYTNAHPCLCKLMGSFVTRKGPSAGERWLVFRDDGTETAARYASRAANATSRGMAVGEGEFWDRLDPLRPLSRRGRMIRNIARKTMDGLAYMHRRERLHQSLGPTSVVLRNVDERMPDRVEARLRDLAFGVDVSEAGINTRNEGKELAEELWTRAAREGAETGAERRAYGMADDVFMAGMFLAYLCFIPLCEPGTIDGPSLQRLLESTFQADVSAFRDYCEADERWVKAVRFLDSGEGAGWSLLEEMLNKDWRSRPTVQSCMDHPFLR